MTAIPSTCAWRPGLRRGQVSRRLCALALAAVGAGAFGVAHAGCGTSFCAINTDWDVQGQWTGPGVRFDLRYEYIDQDQPRSGTDSVSVGEVPRHHDEQYTINRNLLGSVDVNFNERWGLAIKVPFVDREHAHVHNHHGHAIDQSWAYRELGDVSAIGQYRLGHGAYSSYGVRFGVKLPTGDTEVRNEAGELAERSLQPGSGTTDAIVGLFYQGRSVGFDWFAQARYQRPLSDDDGYEPGDEFALDLGMSRPLIGELTGMLQLNLSSKGRLREDQAPEHEADSGGDFVFVSPGLGYRLFDALQVYGFAQLPVYQDVNGVQLTADWAGVVGVSTRF